jgi:hypothetical protein
MRIQIILHHNHPTDSLRLLFRLFPLKALPTLVPAQKTSSTVPATPLHYSKIHAISPTPKFEIELLQVNLQTAQSTEVRNPLTLLCIFQTGSITLEPPGHFRATSSNYLSQQPTQHTTPVLLRYEPAENAIKGSNWAEQAYFTENATWAAGGQCT